MPNSPIGPDGQPVQSLLDLAQPQQPQMPAGGWAPSWVAEQLAAFNRDAPVGGRSSDIGFGTNAGQLAPYMNAANWGPPPAPNGPMSAGQGWFPQQFSGGGNDPTGKFWTQSAYASQFPGGSQVMDTQPNTLNWHLVGGGNEPGDFMIGGHPISQSKLYYDTHRPISDPATAGSFQPYHGFGTGSSGWSTTGEVGFPGQLDPFATIWGAGGPGG